MPDQLNNVAFQVQYDLILTKLWHEGWILNIARPCFDSGLGDRDWNTNESNFSIGTINNLRSDFFIYFDIN